MLMKTNMSPGDQNLLSAAQAARETSSPFDMAYYGHPCGTPACVLGNYAMRPDLQSTFTLRPQPGSTQPMAFVLALAKKQSLACDDAEVREHFELSKEQACDLFAYAGCGRARTGDEAADYIERFVTLRIAARIAA